MLNANLLRGKMAENSYNQGQLAEKLGLSVGAMSNKLKGKTELTLKEISKLCELLKIHDPDDIVKIFLS